MSLWQRLNLFGEFVYLRIWFQNIYRVTHIRRDCKDDLKLFELDDSKVKLNIEYNLAMAYSMIKGKKVNNSS